jgi:hypothetical protein
MPGGGAIGGIGGGTQGEITAVDGDTLTVSTPDGRIVAVTTTGETAITHVEEGELADLAVGDQVRVIGTPDSAESEATSVTATAITEGDAAGTFPGGGGFGGRPTGDIPSQQAPPPGSES